MTMLDALRAIFQTAAVHAALWGMATSFGLCVLLVLTQRWHGRLTMDQTDGVQKFHTAPTPRIGGVPIVLGLLVAWSQASVNTRALLSPILMAGMPAFVFGLLEDITKRVGVMQRLLATMASGLLAYGLTDYALTRLDIVGLDWLLGFAVVSALFTAFAVGGVANSINIIDGFNGLASTTCTLAFMGFAMMAWQVGDYPLAAVGLLLAASVWGFFWVNWPLGKIFLGDGGSYFIGFALAWVAILLIERNPNVSAFAALVVCAHPVTEVLFSIYRRRIKKLHPGHPDRLHFHSLLKQRYVRRWLPRLPSHIRNSVTGLLAGGMTLTAVVLANLCMHSVLLSLAAAVALALGYVAVYARMVRHRWCSPISFLLVKPQAKRSQALA